MDGIFICASTQEKLNKCTEKIMQRLAEHGVRSNKDNTFFQNKNKIIK